MKLNMLLRKIFCEEVATNGPLEMKPLSELNADTDYTNALHAASLPANETPNSTTQNPWCGSAGTGNLLANLQAGSLYTNQAGQSFANPAIQPKQSEKTNKGVKFDDNKPALAYIPKEALYEEGRAFAYGAKKYEAWNYRNGIAITRTLSAAIRHIVQFIDGENIDQESGVNHLGCARANLAMAIDTLKNHPEFDDRFKGNKK